MKYINGMVHCEVSDLKTDLELAKNDMVVYAMWHDENGVFHEHPVCKTEESADGKEMYLYLGDDRKK